MSHAEDPIRVVFDCNVLLQAASNRRGPAAACLEFVRAGQITLVTNTKILAEFREVASRPRVARKLSLPEATVASFVEDVLKFAEMLDEVPEVFTHPLDPKDSVYINVAIAAHAAVITSRDMHMLALADQSRIEGTEFRARFPEIDILTPTQLLTRARSA